MTKPTHVENPNGLQGREASIRRRNRNTFTEVAAEYSRLRRDPWVDCLIPFNQIPRGGIIMDGGAGAGRQTVALASGGLNVVAIDFSASMLRILQHRAKRADLDGNISVVVGDLVALPFRGESFEGIELVAALHHIPTRKLRERVIGDLCALTRPRGKLVITAWFRDQTGFLLKLAASALGVASGKSEWGDVWMSWSGRPRYYHLFELDELRSLVESSGLHVESLEIRSFVPETRGTLRKNVFAVATKAGATALSRGACSTAN